MLAWIKTLYEIERDAKDLDAAQRRALRSIALGRKNYLFICSHCGGLAAATLYSVIKSAQRHSLDPFHCLRDLFLRIPTHPNKDLHLILPGHWKHEILPTLDLTPFTAPLLKV